MYVTKSNMLVIKKDVRNVIIVRIVTKSFKYFKIQNFALFSERKYDLLMLNDSDKEIKTLVST